MKKFFLLVILIFIFFPDLIFGASLSNEKINDLFSIGKKYFHKGNELSASNPEKAKEFYQDAVMHFERIVNEGNIRNSKLYYNIGNIYFRMGDIGNAILNYRRAFQYIPNDTNLQQNLKFARTRRKDHFEEIQKTKILRTVFFWHYDISSRLRISVFIISFFMVWLFALIRIFRKNPIMQWGFVIALIFSVLFGASLIIEEISINKIRPGVIIAPEVVARKGDSNTYEPAFKEPIHSGTEFNLIEHRGNWYHIKLPDSRTCWIPRKAAELVR
ncbi:MAG: hypothetical protein SCARUB_01857 [Candidatus Scalindua rubra]|uniref:Uncharacterized protein n=1 Tax=Candidatus Scalindua rubra TaxID=1872076 RepID=A0A1E3XBQ4_9BACT|nr:MAG: hypothetical protein SCARUB_01857 [Candidatus Scalindua rubra]